MLILKKGYDGNEYRNIYCYLISHVEKKARYGFIKGSKDDPGKEFNKISGGTIKIGNKDELYFIDKHIAGHGTGRPTRKQVDQLVKYISAKMPIHIISRKCDRNINSLNWVFREVLKFDKSMSEYSYKILMEKPIEFKNMDDLVQREDVYNKLSDQEKFILKGKRVHKVDHSQFIGYKMGDLFFYYSKENKELIIRKDKLEEFKPIEITVLKKRLPILFEYKLPTNVNLKEEKDK